MSGLITVRIDLELERLLDKVARRTGRSRSEVTRDALRRQLAIELLDELRRRVAPFAEARGLLTDEDVLKLVS